MKRESGKWQKIKRKEKERRNEGEKVKKEIKKSIMENYNAQQDLLFSEIARQNFC